MGMGDSAGTAVFTLPGTQAHRVEVISFSQAGHLVAYALVTPSSVAKRRQLLLPLQALSDAAKAHHLFTIARDRLAHWALATLRRRAGLTPSWGLLALPQGVLATVLGKVDRESLLSCACSCKGLQAASSDGALWEARLRTDFGNAAPALQVR